MIESKAQIALDFTVGLNDQYPEIMDVIRAVCEPDRARKQKKAIAADMDWSPSEFSRAINENGDRPLKVSDLPRLLDAVPASRGLLIEWLVERYLDSTDNRQKRAADVILQLAPPLLEAIAVIKERGGGERSS